MKKERSNIIKWWYVSDQKGEITGLRGMDTRLDVRYELVPEDDTWRVSHVVHFQYDDGWGFQRVHDGTLFECMRAAEEYADSWYQSETEAEQERRD